ncbi:hypothetical protein GCM10010174_01220 [Kutzneria viridogrisea]|uniref:RNA polymerase sigma factor (Sigma-70 family) n=1 Tax=Kutzneria viridogrisea TaxID=47990 RepID=A0ABR6BCP3_9PSEU|nr:RNA polymerase sigma factor (sigma-70 family) [Kutzneria viridogrisea]
MPESVPVVGDTELIAAVRAGSSRDFELLYQRHSGAARAFALHLTANSVEADDLVAEAFLRVLTALRAGRGPNEAFRSYLLVTLRNVSHEQFRRGRRVSVHEDMSEFDGGYQPDDVVLVAAERSIVAQAYAQLPERWRTVLWHTEVEGSKPTEVAGLLGLTPNGVAALAYRAREGLRQAYLQAHLAAAQERCRATVARLGAWARTGLSRRESVQVESHLDGCERCRQLAAELSDLNYTLAARIGPLLLGTVFWQWSGTPAPTTTAVVVPPQPAAGPSWLGAAGSSVALAVAVTFGLVTGMSEERAAAAETARATTLRPTAEATTSAPATSTTTPTLSSTAPSSTSTRPPTTTTAVVPPTTASAPVTTPPTTTTTSPPPARPNWSLTGSRSVAGLAVTATNQSGQARVMTLEITPPRGAVIQSADGRCNLLTSLLGGTVRCVVTVAPGQSFTTHAWLVGDGHQHARAVLRSDEDVLTWSV